MNRGENSDFIPIDLILEILSRLPAKSIAKFHCVSKLWRSLLCKPYFTELFMTRSSSRLRLLIAVQQEAEVFMFTSPQPQNPSSLVVSAEFHTKISFNSINYYGCRYASGLLYFPTLRFSKEGFDPIGKQFKVLAMFNSVNDHSILTLGTEKLSWRTIQSPSSEEFKVVGHECDFSWTTNLVNYKGKLGVIEHDLTDGLIKLQMWVLEDIDKNEWSKLYDYILKTTENKVVKDITYLSVVGVTASGEIVLADYDDACEPFYVFYFNPEKNTLRSVEIQGVRQEGVKWINARHEVQIFLDHVEDLNLDVMKLQHL
ncbi:putative F-box protein At1g30920 [Capsella rubella]|uniref:putative F-box protein At1g30920 n=1 Tax=Capsella rubella TaxID=81985 RepID=UPI000CD598AB|nr:putative F-box protein At1g30920 [Capsella rubella]